MSIWLGIDLVRLTVPDVRKLFSEISGDADTEILPASLFLLPAGSTVGILAMSWFSYILTLLGSRLSSNGNTVRIVCLVISCIAALLVIAYCESSFRKGLFRKASSVKELSDGTASAAKVPGRVKSSDVFYVVTALVVTALTGYIMFDACRMSGETLLVGYTAAKDIGPHAALVSSFAKGFNFPTGYPYFASDGIQYHFLFFYFCGTLQYLGLPLVWALNLPSILTMVSAMTLSGLLALLWSKRKSAFALTQVLILFRSSFNFLFQLLETMNETGSFAGTIREMLKYTPYYGKTEYESWGIWTINIYGNQRHLMLGMSCIVILIMLFLPFVRRMFEGLAEVPAKKEKLHAFFLGRHAWIPEKKELRGTIGRMILAYFILAALPYFHGSMLISGLLVLAGLAVFSSSRLCYAAGAALAVISALAQSALFGSSAREVFSLRFHPGFYSDELSLPSILTYVILITGCTLILAWGYVMWENRFHREAGNAPCVAVYGFAAMVPMVFAFLFQPTKELLTNHKFIQVTIILMDVLAACAVGRGIFKDEKPRMGKTVLQISCAVLAAFILGLSSIFEWATYSTFNSVHEELHPESEMVTWICENTDPDDVFLTPGWKIHDFFLSGRMAYCGYYYYTWSAGYDVASRSKIYSELLSGCGGDVEHFRKICKDEGIRYVIASPDYETVDFHKIYEFENNPQAPEISDYHFDQEFFDQHLTAVAVFEKENVTIYKVEE
ncbi:MAG: hypothetical protein J5379_03885 [Clostridiales bacterium]|nr:hypothetical protein [Clostridiales bacterium]